MSIDLTEIRELFLEESFEHLHKMEADLLKLQSGETDKELIHSIFRCAHSIKGGAGIFKFEHIVNFAHSMETLLDKIRQKQQVIIKPINDLLLNSVDILRIMILALKNNNSYNIEMVQTCQIKLTNALHQEKLYATKPVIPPENKIFDKSQSNVKIPTKNTTLNIVAGNPLNFIRVSTDKIDNLINMVGELVITQSMLERMVNKINNSCARQLRDGLAQLERNSRELQDSVMQIRMLPISFAFNRFPRLVHDLSLKLDKKIDLIISGERTELDKTVLEKIGELLIHLVRNAIVHGIETSEQRLAAGKFKIGQLRLHAFHQSGNIVIQVSDDGIGFDTEKIRSTAIKKGLLNQDESCTTEQLYEFIFQPGFSTTLEVNDLSGRGVGMDVVRRNIRELGGTIEIKSTPGQGSTFSIHLPLSLAILEGQLIRIGTEIYILSLLSIIESLRINPKLVNKLSGITEVYKLHDEYIPILRLYELFNITPHNIDLEKGLLVVVESEGQKIGLFVDELLSQRQIVIKSLINYKKVPGISGATILGNGAVALILDIFGLIELFHSHIEYNKLHWDS